MRCGTIVVLYNPTDGEISNLKHNLGKTELSIIIDNSKQSNYELVKNCGKNVKYFNFKSNIGLCKALNYGIQELLKDGCEWAFVLDADSVIDNNILNVYKDYISNNNVENVAVLAPVHIFERSKSKAYSGNKVVKRSMTSGWFININIFEKNLGFYEPLFVDGLDHDYCYRVRKKGYKVIECGEAIINHHPGNSVEVRFFGKKKIIGIDSPLRYRMGATGEWWNLLHNKSLYDGAFFFYRIIKVLLYFPNKNEYFRQMFKGAKKGIELYKNEKKE